MTKMQFKHKESDAFVKAVNDQLKEKFGRVKASWKPIIVTIGQQYDLYLQALEEVQKEGLTIQTTKNGITSNPLIKVSNDAIIQVQKLVNMLGISPSSLVKLKLEAPNDTSQEEEDDFLSALTK